MLKKLGVLAISSLIIIGGILILREFKVDEDIQSNNHSDSVDSSTDVESPSQTSPNEGHSKEKLIGDIIEESKNGKVLDTPFIAGKTKIEEVYTKWGDSEQTDQSTNGKYISFSDKDITIGYQNHLIFDIRSYHSELSEIHLKDIKKIMGEPDEVRSYKDQNHNQIILVYHVNSTYQLKWILPKPSKIDPNPGVHHVSIFTELTDMKEDKNAISELLSEMSLEEKIGQMLFTGISDTTLTQHTKSLLHTYKVGGIIFYSENLQTPQQTVQLINEIKTENVQNRLPLLLGVDQEGGRISRLPGGLIDFPTNKNIGKINRSEFSYEIGTLLGKELHAFGFNLNFAPVLDVNSNPTNPIIGDRSFGAQAELVSELGIQTMKGIQSQNILAVIKHFPGHGDTEVDSHLQLPEVTKSLDELERLELIPFKQAINEGADIVMVAHILLPQLDGEFPTSMSEVIITGLLRKQLDFNGVVITDDMSMKAITNHFDIGQAAVESVKAGSDIILVARDYENIVEVIDALKYAVDKGILTEARIDESVQRIIQLKQKYDIDDEKVQTVNVKELNKEIKNVLNQYMNDSSVQ